MGIGTVTGAAPLVGRCAKDGDIFTTTFALCPRYVPRNCRHSFVETASIAMLRFVQRELVTAGCITFFTTYSPICCPISVPTRVENR
jgi:hypothetical protein